MENHVFAVWDFMSILKSLQNKLTCVNVPWTPLGKGNITRLVNDIVISEESDINEYGYYSSHFEMYCHAMSQAGANTNHIYKFLTLLKSNCITKSLKNSGAPDAAIKFVKETFDIIKNAPIHVLASVFTFGREEIIPDMFRSIIKDINQSSNGNLKSFNYYINRHIGLDENEHTPAAFKMVKELCKDDKIKWKEATDGACKTMNSRLKFWDLILKDILSYK